MKNLFFTFKEDNDRNKLLATTIYYDNVSKENDEILWTQQITWRRKITQETVDTVNENPGCAFFLSTNGQLYYGKIKRLSFPSQPDRPAEFNREQSSTKRAFAYLDEWSGGSFTIVLENLTELDYEALDYLFAQRNRSKLGNQKFSLLTKWEKSFFPYARPLIAMDTKTFFNAFSINNTFRENLLYNNQLIPFSNNQGKTFGIIVEEDGKNLISLINEKMLKADRAYFSGESISNEEFLDYRPYVYEFIPEELTDERITRMELEKNQLYPIELLSDEQDNRSDISINETGERFVKGEVLFSASPFERKGNAQLVFNKNKSVSNLEADVEKIFKNRGPVVSDKQRIQDTFEKALSLSSINNLTFTMTVFAVGQANWIIVNSSAPKSSDVSFAFDIGFTLMKDLSNYQKAVDEAALQTKKVSLIMLSHWDLDHILGITTLAAKHLEKTWIVPELPPKRTFSARRLAAYLTKEKDIHPLFVSDKLNNEIIFSTDHFTLGKGRGKGNNKYDGRSWASKYTLENNIGLILEIINNEKSLLLPGDCDYIKFPEYFMKEYDVIVVPHHGAEINNIALPQCKKRNCEAYACVNKGNASYPKVKHKNFLQKRGYKVTSINQPKSTATFKPISL